MITLPCRTDRSVWSDWVCTSSLRPGPMSVHDRSCSSRHATSSCRLPISFSPEPGLSAKGRVVRAAPGQVIESCANTHTMKKHTLQHAMHVMEPSCSVSAYSVYQARPPFLQDGCLYSLVIWSYKKPPSPAPFLFHWYQFIAYLPLFRPPS
jgi:hypothetical protein